MTTSNPLQRPVPAEVGRAAMRPIVRAVGEVGRLGRHAGKLRARSLHLIGDEAALEPPAVAIVGARAASLAALDFARALAERLARAGRTIVSGGALGVDAAAHEGALAAGGRTLVVLGTGVDVPYPERHAGLFDRVTARGLLISPFALGVRARPSRFPARNPLIAALADAVVVVEAGARSGSLGTARAARALGVALHARPGSSGCDALLMAGQAEPAPSVEAVAERLLGLAHPTRSTGGAMHANARMLDALSRPCDAGELAARTGEPLSAVLGALLELELTSQVIRLQGGRYLAVSG